MYNRNCTYKEVQSFHLDTLEAIRIAASSSALEEGNCVTPQELRAIKDAAFLLVCRVFAVVICDSHANELVGPNQNSALHEFREEVICRSKEESGCREISSELCRVMHDLFDRMSSIPFLFHGYFSKLHITDEIFFRLFHLLAGTAVQSGKSYNHTFRSVRVDPSELGKLYENLLDLQLKVACAPTNLLHVRSGYRTVYLAQPTDSPIPKRFSPVGPTLKPGAFFFESIRSERRASGSFFTPQGIVRHMMEQSIGRICESFAKKCGKEGSFDTYRSQILTLRLLDPAVGCGQFLLGALAFLEEQLRCLDVQMPLDNIIELRRRIIGECLYGVDLDPTALEVTKLLLWVESGFDVRTLNSISSNVKCGNAIVGALQVSCPPLKSAFQLTNGDSSNKSVEQKRRIADAWCIMKASPQSLPENFERRLVESASDLESLELFARIPFDSFKGTLNLESIRPFHWELEFPRVVDTRTNRGFDAIIGNPPYGLTRGDVIPTSEQAYIGAEYREFLSGKPNKFLLFEARAHQLVRPGGCVAFLGPNSWFAIPAGKAVREHLLTKQRVSHIDYYCYPVFPEIGVEVASIVSWRLPPGGAISFRRYSSSTDFITLEMDSADCLPPEYIIPLNRSSRVSATLQVLLSKARPLTEIQELFCCRVGLQAYATGRGDPPQSTQVVEEHPYHSPSKKDASWFEYLEGSNVGRYFLNASGSWLHFGPWLAEYPSLTEYSGPRIAIREILGEPPNRFLATFIEHTAFYNRSILHIFCGKKGTKRDILALLGIINSSIGSFYISFAGRKSDRRLFPKIILTDLKHFPVPLKFDEFAGPLAALVEKLLFVRDELTRTRLEANIEDLVGSAYDLGEKDLEQIRSSATWYPAKL